MSVLLTLVVIAAVGFTAVYLVQTQNWVREWVGLRPIDSDEKARKETIKQLEKLNKRSDQQRLGYRFAADDPFLFIHNKGVWTGVVLPTYNDDFTTADQQESGFDDRSLVYRSLLDFIEAQKGDKKSVVCHELMRYQPVDASGWETEYLQNAWSPSELFNDLVSEHVRPQLEQTSPESRRFLFIRLGDYTGRTNVDPLTMVLERSDHVTEEHFERKDIEAFREQAAELHDHLGIEPCTRADLSWIIRKVLAGHFEPSMERDVVATRPWRAGYFDQIVDFTGVNKSHFVEIDNPDMHEGSDEKSYVATLVVADSEPILPFRYDGAWGKVIRTLDFPVGISWRYTLMTGEQWAKESKRKIDSILDEANDRAKAGKDSDELFNLTHLEALDMKAQNEVNPEPAMVGQLRFTVAAASPRELETAVTQLRTRITDMTLTQPRRIQHALLREQLPGDPDANHVGRVNMATASSLGIDKGTRYNDLNALAVPRLESVPNVGDAVEYERGGTLGWHGHLIGYSQVTGAAVHFDPHVQMDRHQGAGVGIVGFSGGGKSSLALTLFFWMSEAGTQCVAVDPKNDFQAFCYYLSFGPQVLDPDFEEERQQGVLGTEESKFVPVNQDFWDDTDIIDLLHGPRGMLGAWDITSTYEEGEALAWEQLELLVPNADDRDLLVDGMHEIRTAYAEAQSKGEQYTPSLSMLAQFLAKDEEAYSQAADPKNHERWADRIAAKDRLTKLRALRQRLENAANGEFARLLFSDPNSASDNGFKSIRKRRTILTLFGFKPPNPDKDDPAKWSTTERNAAAAMFTVLHSINEFFTNTNEVLNPTTGRRERLKRALFIDEGYILTAIEAGRELLAKALRQGRSLRFAVIFISQQAGDVQAIEKKTAKEGHTDQNQFATVFVFQQRGMPEAESALELLREHDDAAASKKVAKKLLPVSNGGNLSRGVCVMRDVDNRVAIMHVDPMFEELYAAEQTESRQRAIQQQWAVPARGRDWTRDTSVRDAVRRASENGATADEAVTQRGEFEFDEYDVLTAEA